MALPNPPTGKRVDYSSALLELVKRDPLFVNITALESDLHQGTSEQREQALARLQDLNQELFIKYGLSALTLQDRPSFILRMSPSPLYYETNYLTFSPGTKDYERRPPPLTKISPPTLIVHVDLSRVTQWDLSRMTSEFQAILKRFLRKGHSWNPRSIPPELSFLRTKHSQVFYRDLQRFDLHFQHGLTYRLIALLERHGLKWGQSEKPQPRRVGFPIPAESSVADSVQQIYSAIYRAPYRAKRRRLDFPAFGIKVYHCPTHGLECPGSCPFLKRWWAAVEPTLPTNSTGS